MKLRLKAYDMTNELWVIQRRFLFIWWYCSSLGTGSHKIMEKMKNNILKE